MSGTNEVWRSNTDIEVVKKDTLSVAEHHANKQIDSLKKHAKLLVEQAVDIEKRVELTRKISKAEYGFKPVHLKEYYLYSDREDKLRLTLISPQEWKNKCPYGEFIATVRQLGDSTWEEVKLEK